MNVYKINSEYEKLFNELDKECIGQDQEYPCEPFDNVDIQESFKSEVKKIFNILKRSNKDKNIYINGKTLGNFNPCVFYKYWFYHKIIYHNFEEIDIKKLQRTWHNSLTYIYGNLFGDHCKFYAKSLDDVKILKVLYDYVLFFNNTEYSLLNEIKNCEFCKLLKIYLDETFSKGNITCNTASPYALCMEHNDTLKSYFDFSELFSLSCEYNVQSSPSNKCQKLYERLTEKNNLVTEKVVIEARNDNEASISVIIIDDPQGSNSNKESVIAGTAILGLSFTLFILYKFTSFGSLVHRRIGQITHTWKNSQDDEDVLLLRDSETENINFDKTQYNLAYTTI
ncbi:PIR protein [Plasmodium ovale]|uniref:PIR protein n=1 Tax=Plasmodium ovale TaxID=36330 RepID=A0A1D3KWL8_PLAOA|nr:PIR protein [Plasmodium ovale]